MPLCPYHVFNLSLLLEAGINQGYGYAIELLLQNSEYHPPIDSTVYVKWLEQSDEPPGWYRTIVSEYFQDDTCKLLYNDTVLLMLPFLWLKPSARHYLSSEHSVKGYADDATLISNSLDAHISVLQQVDLKASNLDLSFKPCKCISYLFDGHHLSREGIQLSGGSTRSITDGGTKFLEKLLHTSLSATKAAVKKK